MELTERQKAARLRLGTEKGRACSVCEEFKEWGDFSPVPAASTGRHSQCKGCQTKKKKEASKNRTPEQVEEQAAKNKAYRESRTPEQIAKRAIYCKIYSAANRERTAKKEKQKRKNRTPAEIAEQSAKKKIYSAKNKERRAVYNKARSNARTPEEIEERAKYSKTWFAANKKQVSVYGKEKRAKRTPKQIEEQAAKNKVYSIANKEHNAKRAKAYRQTPKGKLLKLTQDHKRRFLKQQAADGTIPLDLAYPLAADLQALWDGQHGRCNVCNSPLEQETGHDNSQHLDHHEPLSKGGAHSIGNVVWLCRSCNLSKHDKTPTAPLTFRIHTA